MKKSKRPILINVQQSHGTHLVPVVPYPDLPSVFHESDLPSPPLTTPDLGARVYFETRDWPAFMVSSSGILACTESVFSELLGKGMARATAALDLPLVQIESERRNIPPPPRYKWLYPEEHDAIESCRVDDAGHPSSEGRFHRYLMAGPSLPSGIFRPRNGRHILCSIEFLCLARANNWKGLWFSPSDIAGDAALEWGIDYLGKQWPPQWWPAGHEPHPLNAVDSEMPDVRPGKDAPGRSSVDGHSPPRQTRLRKPDPDGRLISLADVLKLKLRAEGPGLDEELAAEVPLNRPLYGSDTLGVSVVIENEHTAPKRAEIKEAVQGILNLFERVLPEIEKRVKDELTTGDPAQTEALLAGLHSPGLLFMADQLGSPIRWSFVVEGEPLAVHVEFERLDIVDVWAGD